MNKIAIIGSRGFSDYTLFVDRLEYITQNISIGCFVSGGCKNSADELIARYAKEKGYNIIEFFPEYDKYNGKIAPIKRNQQIVDEATHIIAFHNGTSKGTLSALKMAEKKNIPIKIIKI